MLTRDGLGSICGNSNKLFVSRRASQEAERQYCNKTVNRRERAVRKCFIFGIIQTGLGSKP